MDGADVASSFQAGTKRQKYLPKLTTKVAHCNYVTWLDLHRAEDARVKSVTNTLHPASSQTGDWYITALDLDAYLHRIGKSAARPSEEALSALHEAHVRTVPFGNVDVLLGHPPSLELSDIADKLVHRRRGGYCFEHGLLFAAALERLGYHVTRCLARVQPDSPGGAKTHLVLVVDVRGKRFLADTGFGSGLLVPLPLEDGATTEHGGWPYRLRRDGRLWRLEKPGDGGADWTAVYAFDETPQRPIDYVVANHFTATHPRSPFTQRLIVQRIDHGICRKLVGRGLLTEHPGRTPEQPRPVSADELGEVLHSLGLALDEDELAQLRQVYAGAEKAES